MTLWRRMLVLLLVGATLGGELIQFVHCCNMCSTHAATAEIEGSQAFTGRHSSACCGEPGCGGGSFSVVDEVGSSDGCPQNSTDTHDQDNCAICQASCMAKSAQAPADTKHFELLLFSSTCCFTTETFYIRSLKETDLVRGPPVAIRQLSSC